MQAKLVAFGVLHHDETTGKENLVEVVRAALVSGADVVAAAGGDGTVATVATALVGTDIPLGIIPLGTANVFARELGIPRDLDDACALLAEDYLTTIVDAMQVGDRYFVLQIGIGIDSLMIHDTERKAKRRFGRAAYLWSAFTRLIGYEPRRFTIVVDGTSVRARAAEVVIANGGVLGVPPYPWSGPSSEAKAAAEPAKAAVKEAIQEIKTPAQAEHVADEVLAAAGNTRDRGSRAY